MPFKPVWLAGAAAALAALAWYLGGAGGEPARVGRAAPAHTAGTRFFSPLEGAGDPLALPPAGRAARLQQLQQQFALVDKTYCEYAQATRYPDASRPLSENPDQVYPNALVTESHALSDGKGKGDASVQIQSTQSRVFMVAGESAAFSLRALDAEGKVLPLVITRAVAQGMTYKDTRPTAQVSLPFADDGKGADAAAGDGSFAAVLAPAQTGLAGFNGTIRTEVRYSVAGKNGVLLFDVIYSPEVPAIWTGQPREVVENGSLVYYLKADVRQAGRYVVSGRVDDARGKPFALATFNEVLPAGPAEIRLTVFGKLLRDQSPALPLTLRDVEGYLLKENTDPDRALMPRLEGKVLTGKPYPLKNFSDAEWQSEERSRHLTEFAKDVGLARAALKEFDPALPDAASACP